MIDWWWAYLALGAFVGFFSGMLGIGGGSMMVPVLAFVFAAKGFGSEHAVHLALGTGISTILFTSVVSVRAHHLRHSVNWRAFRAMTPGVLAGTFTGALLAGHLDTRLLSIVFTALIYYSALQLIRTPEVQPAGALPSAAAMSGFGALIGFFASLTATGGSSIMVPFLAKRAVPIHEGIGTAAAVGWPIAAAGAAGYVIGGWRLEGLPGYSLGYIYLPALAIIVAASVVLAPVGAAVAHRTAGRTLKTFFALFLFVLATSMLVKFV